MAAYITQRKEKEMEGKELQIEVMKEKIRGLNYTEKQLTKATARAREVWQELKEQLDGVTDERGKLIDELIKMQSE